MSLDNVIPLRGRDGFRRDLPSLARLESWPANSAAAYLLANSQGPSELARKFGFEMGPRRIDQVRVGDLITSVGENFPFIVRGIEPLSEAMAKELKAPGDFLAVHVVPIADVRESEAARFVVTASYQTGTGLPFPVSMTIATCGRIVERGDTGNVLWSCLDLRPYLSQEAYEKAKAEMRAIEQRNE